jgi:hypothetical protein
MDPMKLARSVAAAMARDVRDARWKVLRKLTVEEAYMLMTLWNDLELVSDMNWHDSLARRLETGHHIIGRNLELDEEEAIELSKEMAAAERESKRHMRELMREPMTIERLRKGEELLRSKGVEINLLDRSQVTEEVPLN